MPEIIISDTSCLIILQKTGQLAGTLGILLKAKHLGVVPSLKQILDELRKTDFRISQEIIDSMLKEAGEN